MNNYCVYKHTSPSTKVYIGITKQAPNGRWKNGLGYESSPHFWNAIKKYGWENFKHEVLYTGLSCEHACLIEQMLIEEYDSTNPLYGYNQKIGGQTGSSPSQEVRNLVSQKMKKYYAEHPEARERLAKSATGKKWTDEQRTKYITAKKGKHLEISEVWRAKMIAGTRKRYSEDIALREITIKRCIENGKKNSMPVVQMDLDGNDIASFESASEAQRQTGAKNCNIIMCCKGTRHTANGYKWRFANTDNGGREIA